MARHVTEPLKIWQHNVNRSPICQHTLLSNKILVKHNVDIVALQEPSINGFNNSIASKDWISIYPTTHCAHPGKTRTMTLIRSSHSTDSWEQLDFPSGDVTIISLKGTWGKLTLFNIYNDGNHNDTLKQIERFHDTHRDIVEHVEAGEAHVVWVGDFNRHHPHWDDPNDTRLFTNEAIKAADVLIEVVASLGLDLALPSGLPTHLHNVTKKWTRLDQVFLSDHSFDLLISCDTETRFRSTKTDHLPIITTLNLAIPISPPTTFRNFRDVDWSEFHDNLSGRLSSLDAPSPIRNQERLNASCDTLTETILDTVKDCVPSTVLCAKSKRWWTKELTQMRRNMNKLGRQSYKLRNNPAHPTHKEHTDAEKLYDRTLERTKRQHWRDWLERAEDPDIWSIHKYTSQPSTDGARARIPALKHKRGNAELTATTNTEKAQALAKSFFPAKPADPEDAAGFTYPPACCKPDQVTKEQILLHIRKLKPYKAPGPDGIPNIVLMRCADLLVDRLLYIYKAMLERNLHYSPWKSFTTVVLRKPGKPRYDVPKAYRPIALLNTMWKVLAAIVAEQLTYYSERYNLLPAHHFGGRPGRSTTDAVHLLVHNIKNSWRKGNVTSVLFLDVEGAFPNAVPRRLVHNLRKRRIPRRYVSFIEGMLEGRSTHLKFDDHISDTIEIDNGIGQGDPLSMVLYQFYNADILDIPSMANEAALAYVDDALILASAPDFDATHNILNNMMTREGGIYDWSTTHNSPLEHSKLALIDFAHRNNSKPRQNLILPNVTIEPSQSTKYLGILIDQHLNWKAQHAYTIEKGTKWTLQIRRITRPSWGITPKYARRLYIGVALPRILYGVDVWCGPPMNTHTEVKNLGTSRIINKLTSTQRSGTLAVTGGLRTSPTDALDACAFLLPLSLTIERWSLRAAVRLASSPPEHPLYKPVKHASSRNAKRHRSPLHSLLGSIDFNPKLIEKIPAKPRNPALTGKLPFTVSIALSKESSVAEDRHAQESVRIYTDGSAHNGKVGAAAILMQPDEPHRTLHYHLGSDKQHTVHEAENIGILLALHLILTERSRNRTFAIGTDNQAALEAFDSNLRSPAHHISREAIRLGNMISKRSRGRNHALTLRWTAGHAGIPGNELADKEAKKAASGLTSDKKLLPPYLRRVLLTNPSAVIQHKNSETKKKWLKKWKNSKRGRKLANLGYSTPSINLTRIISGTNISRRSASLVTQLLLNHVPLNSYLHKFKTIDSARCPACGAVPETVRHFLLECPIYAHERWILEKGLRKGNKALMMRNLLGDAESIGLLINYINATHRFQST